MYSTGKTTILAVILISLLSTSVAAEKMAEATAQSNDQKQHSFKGEQTSAVPRYVPPMRGAPSGARLESGGARGFALGQVGITALAPDHVGLTIQNQPTLYWYLSEIVPTRLELTLIADSAIYPLAEVGLEPPKRAGLQRLRLSELGVSLKPDVEYQWTVSLIHNSSQRSNDILTGGGIRHIQPSSKLQLITSSVSERRLPFIYAEEGLWYDAIASVSDLIESNPGDATLRRQRAALLQQIGLQALADADRGLKEN